MRIPNRARAFVSGGASGLGRAICLELAARQARIVVADLDADGAEETAELVRRAGGEADAVVCDVSRLKDVEAAASRLDERFGGVDVVVNNAGVACAGRVGDVSMEDWKWIVGVNQWGVIHGCHVFVPRLVSAGRGWILNVASMAGIAMLPEMAPYNVTKAAVIALSETLYTELAAQNIAVTVACPTFFATNLMKSFRSPEAKQRERAESFFSRAKATADEVARDSIRGLESGKLHVITQRDGKIGSFLKRLAPQSYFRLLRRQVR